MSRCVVELYRVYLERDMRKSIQPWPVEQLKDHPRQAELFTDLTEAQLEELAENIDKNGLDHPIEILPDGVIICGHQRRRAVARLGWETVPVIVRHDLANADPGEIEVRLIAAV